MNKVWLILSMIIWNISGQLREEIVQCNTIDVRHQALERMNLKEQEEYVKSILNEYDKNLSSIAYLTSAAEYQINLHLNDSNQKRLTEKYYEYYHSCLKTIAFVARQFKSLMMNNQSSIRWLLLRTQSIGDAGETDTSIKAELQRLKSRIREIYHRKFLWNQTRLGIDEVQDVLGSLESPDELLSLWNATYEVPASMRDYYSTLIAVQNQQAKQNRTSAVTHSHI